MLQAECTAKKKKKKKSKNKQKKQSFLKLHQKKNPENLTKEVKDTYKEIYTIFVKQTNKQTNIKTHHVLWIRILNIAKMSV